MVNVFIAGPRAVRTLNKKVKNRIDKIMQNNFTILVGDAAGIDKQIQSYCYSVGYRNVNVFASNGKARNNIGGWDVKHVEVAPNTRGFDFYAAKDLEMAKQADYGFMIWNGKSKGTHNNMINLATFNKKILLYMTSDKQFYVLNALQEVEDMKNGMNKQQPDEISVKESTTNKQLSLFH